MKDAKQRFRAREGRFRRWFFGVLLLLNGLIIVWSDNYLEGLLRAMIISVPLLFIPFVIYTEYIIEDGQIKKYSYGTNQSGLDNALVINLLEEVSLIKEEGKIIGFKLYNSDKTIPRATIRVQEASRFLNILKQENPNLRII